MLGELVEIVVAEAQARPVDVEPAHHRVAKSSATSPVTDSMCGFGRPGTMSRPRCLSFGSHSSAVAMASATASTGSVMPCRCVGQPVEEVVGRVHRGRHEQGVGAGEVPVYRLAGDAERAGDVGDGEVGTACVDRLARRVEDARDGFVVAGGRGA